MSINPLTPPAIELSIVDGQIKTTSRIIADDFSKRHDNVIQKIKRLDCSEEFTDLNFKVSEYTDESGKVCKEYQITRDGFTYLGMSFTGKRAATFKERYINAFNQMEAKLRGEVKEEPKSLLDIINEKPNVNTQYFIIKQEQGKPAETHQLDFMMLRELVNTQDEYGLVPNNMLNNLVTSLGDAMHKSTLMIQFAQARYEGDK